MIWSKFCFPILDELEIRVFTLSRPQIQVQGSTTNLPCNVKMNAAPGLARIHSLSKRIISSIGDGSLDKLAALAIEDFEFRFRFRFRHRIFHLVPDVFSNRSEVLLPRNESKGHDLTRGKSLGWVTDFDKLAIITQREVGILSVDRKDLVEIVLYLKKLLGVISANSEWSTTLLSSPIALPSKSIELPIQHGG
jgi:hypothetical protein